jgi:hypothetical protein
MAAGRIASAARKVPLHQVGLGLGALALAVSGLFGGLGTTRDSTPTVKLGAAIDGGPWRVTFLRARLFNELPPLSLQKKGDRWLAIVATVEVTTAESRNDMNDILRVPAVPGLLSKPPSYVVLARDATNVSYLNPGMPEKIGFFWEQSADSPAPTEVDVRMLGKIQRADSLTGHLNWFDDPTARAQIHLTVDDQRNK